MKCARALYPATLRADSWPWRAQALAPDKYRGRVHSQSDFMPSMQATSTCMVRSRGVWAGGAAKQQTVGASAGVAARPPSSGLGLQLLVQGHIIHRAAAAPPPLA